MESVETLTDLANALEVFFKGLSECGLLTTYSVQLQVTSVDFVVQIKFRCLMYQFIKSLQVLLLKTPAYPGHENSHGIATQTSPDLKPNIVEVKLPGSTEQVVTEQIGSLVEACVFTQAEDSLNWEESRNGVTKEQHNGNFIAQSTALGSTTDIIVTCHPAALAAITGHNFITSTTETVLTANSSSVKNTLLKPCVENSCVKEEGDQECLARESKSSPPSVSKNKLEEKVLQINEQNSSNLKASSEQYIDIHNNKTELNAVTVSELKPFISTNTNTNLTEQLSTTTLKSLDQQQIEEMEPLILETYEDEPNAIGGSKFALENSNVMHIVVASAEQQKDDEETNIETDVEENETAIFICEVCERTFITARSLEIHLSLKHRNKGQCDMCPLRFGSVQSLQEHCKTDHGGTGCFNCLVCSRRFMTKLSYKRHMDTHGGKKGAVCDMCGKTFSRTDYLQKHYMIHNGNRPFTCSHCPRKFISSSQLKVHEKTHSGVKEHVCDMCNKAFSRGDKLKDHMLRHLNIKRFQCSYCKRDYAEKRDLNKHLKVHMK